MKKYPLRAPSKPAVTHLAALDLADRIVLRLDKAAPRHPRFPRRRRDGQPCAIERPAAITLSLAYVERALREGVIDAGDLLEMVEGKG